MAASTARPADDGWPRSPPEVHAVLHQLERPQVELRREGLVLEQARDRGAVSDEDKSPPPQVRPVMLDGPQHRLNLSIVR